MFPRFRITGANSTEAVGTLTATTFGKENWVGEDWLGYLMTDSQQLIRGRWHGHEDKWGFAPDATTALERLRPQTEWSVLDSYWGERAEIVMDSQRAWQKLSYEEADHDHCGVCWEKLGQGGESEGYVSEGSTWICTHCYESFVRTRSLDFILQK